MRLSLSTAVVLVAAMLPIAACGANSTTTHSATSSVAGTTSSAAGTPSSGAAPAPPNPAGPICPLTVDAVQATIGKVFRGPVKLDNTPGDVECNYQVDDNRWLHIRVSPYAVNRKIKMIVNNVQVEYGGTSAHQVFTSAATAFEAVLQAGDKDRGVTKSPDIGAGLVTNLVGGFVLAGTRDVWYSGDFGLNTSRDYNAVAVKVAKALAAL